MHAYFLRPGNPSKQIIYAVDPIRDGKSFTTRTGIAKQDGCASSARPCPTTLRSRGCSTRHAAGAAARGAGVDFDRWTRLAQEHPDKIAAWNLPIERKPCSRAIT